MEFVVLVDKDDNEVGVMEKLEAHEKGKLHRAFSILIFNDKGEILLQKRASKKYHCGGLWTNTCCSHQRKGESTIDASHRRLQEEMGFDTGLEHKSSFIYKAHFTNGLIEHELDHILIGSFNQEPIINLNEVEAWRYVAISDLKREIDKTPELFTPWFKIIVEKHLQELILV